LSKTERLAQNRLVEDGLHKSLISRFRCSWFDKLTANGGN
jgi:hypothetical protein